MLLGFFIISLGQDNVWGLFTIPAFYTDLTFVSVIHAIVIGYMVMAHNQLDARYTLATQFSKRIGRQLVWGVLLPACLSLALGYGYLEGILHYEITETSFFQYEFPISVVIIVAINLVLIVNSLLGSPRHTAAVEKKRVFVLNQGDKKVPVAAEEIACILKEGAFAVVYTFDARQFAISDSLDVTFEQLNPEHFFRANRQCIVHYKVCGPFKVHRSGKLDVTLTILGEKEISISQKRAQDFKTWLKNR